MNSADLYKELKVKRDQIPTNPLLKGGLPGRRELDVSANADVKKIPKDEVPSRKDGRIGGKVASTKSISAGGVTKTLNGVDLPKSKDGLVEYAKKRIKSQTGHIQEQIEVTQDVIDTIKELPSNRILLYNGRCYTGTWRNTVINW